jgi:hypothetical protein
MLVLSPDPKIAERQMVGLIFYLTTFGYIDGEFDTSERQFVREYIDRVVTQRAEAAMSDQSAAARVRVISEYVAHFMAVADDMDRQIEDLFKEVVAEGEQQLDYVRERLKLRCFEIFKCFDEAGQRALMDSASELLLADGVAHPAEVAFRRELQELLAAPVTLAPEGAPPQLAQTRWSSRPTITLRVPACEPHVAGTHPLLSGVEAPYSYDADAREGELDADRALIHAAVDQLEAQRERGEGQLRGHARVAELKGRPPFLDGHVYVVPPDPDRVYELTVLGDVHGCYSCLKAALIQSRFFERVAAFEGDPERTPRPGLVLLGDYIDRGRHSFHGVVRAVLRLIAEFPEYVYVLRGNHEFYLERRGEVHPAVKPADALDAMRPIASLDMLRSYLQLFNALPNVLLFEQLMFVHGGIPKESTLKARFKDLASLNDPLIRLEMMWSDPSDSDAIPDVLQDGSSRFPFGRLQARAFLERIGVHTLVRGHQRIDEGFRINYDDGHILFLTLFSAGGLDNLDLPLQSNYRGVTPMACTVRYHGGDVEIAPWVIDYAPYVTAEHNHLYLPPPLDLALTLI